jgi:hypothetical protein
VIATLLPSIGRLRWGALWVLLAASITSCAPIAYVADAVGGNYVAAKHQLNRATTLVIVDDPQSRLREPSAQGRIASSIRFYLRENTELAESDLVSWSRFRVIRRDLGEDYPATPIAEVGQLAGAKQVIHVLVRSVKYRYGGPIYRPTATVETKVLDAKTGRRLFPKGQAVEGMGGRGLIVKTQLSARRVDRTDRTGLSGMSQELAEQVGRNVAQLFYRHRKRPEGERLQDDG